MSVKENLIAAKALIDTPEKWGKGRDSFPLTRLGGAKCLCAHGALFEAMGGEWASGSIEAIRKLRASLPSEWRYTPEFNDDPATTHADIMALYDRAIEAAE